MSRIAFMTFGVKVAPRGAPEVAEFHDRIGAAFDEAASSDGYIDRSPDPDPWLEGVAAEDQDWGARGPLTG